MALGVANKSCKTENGSMVSNHAPIMCDGKLAYFDSLASAALAWWPARLTA